MTVLINVFSQVY